MNFNVAFNSRFQSLQAQVFGFSYDVAYHGTRLPIFTHTVVENHVK
ncbi:hypothetical protein JJB07_15590 [Tumebacillus sp. ITR2]|uniref:Uncharacterized protein n=1 Tax=Tumebacillus amylolyticus TaxID=2801339 RepID=A0ABS1JCQ3_9BACL|nr:hypothetical protein [Tumebacillus amylolyticus]MBL0388041.1 hypothetical protein [Tumebacillus amylolyticus]